MALIEWNPIDDIQRGFVESNATLCAYTGPVGCGKTGAGLVKLLLMASLQRPDPVTGKKRFRAIWVRSTQSRLLSASVPSIQGWLRDLGTWVKGSPMSWTYEDSNYSLQFFLAGLDDMEAVDRVMGSDASVVLVDEGGELADLRSMLAKLGTRAGRFPPQREEGVATGVRAIVIGNKAAIGSDLHKLCVTERAGTTAYFDAVPAVVDGVINPKCPAAHLAAGYYAEQLALSTPDVCAVYLENSWGIISHGKPLVPEFSGRTHVAQQTLLVPHGAPLRLSLDPGNFPAALVGRLIHGERGNRWEIVGELTAERVSARQFAGRVREWISTRWPGSPIELSVIDKVAEQPTDRDEDLLLIDLYRSALGLDVRAAAASDLDVILEAMRAPFSQMQDGLPAILIDPSCRILTEALASRVCYKEQVSGLEKVTVDQVSRPHPWGDAFMALGYLLCSTGYADLREFVSANKHKARDRRERGERTYRLVDGAYQSSLEPNQRPGLYDEGGNWLRE
jgi:hypothetical protein